MNKTWQIPRRTFLKGLGTVIALPMLEAMLPPAKVLAAGATEAALTFPRRMAFIYIPNGANMEDWTPKSVGADYELPYILQPLAPLKNDFQVILSWKTDSTPMPPEVDPRLAFDRLFSNGMEGETEENREKRDLYNKSILDFVTDDASRLKAQLGYTDRHKLDEYLSAVRELEQRIQQAEKFAASQPDFARPTGVPRQYEQHLRLMYDLMALAFQSDTTRIATFITAHDGDDRPYPFIGVSDGHHTLSHHQNDQEKKEKIAKINHFHTEQFANFLNRLKSVKEAEGTLLDNCMIVYGGAIGDGHRHNH